jgi:hypothetical protein
LTGLKERGKWGRDREEGDRRWYEERKRQETEKRRYKRHEREGEN